MVRASTPVPVDPPVRLAEAVCSVIAEHGLEGASIRKVASAAEVSIGAVQHHFPTKDDMLVAAFEHIVRAGSERVARLPLGEDTADNLSRVLRELLPLDAARRREARVYVAFAARAATQPRLAAVQQATLTGIVDRLARVLEADAAHARAEAELLLAVADGLMFDAITAPQSFDPDRTAGLLDLYLRRLLGS